jgi:hypothetical protein
MFQEPEHNFFLDNCFNEEEHKMSPTSTSLPESSLLSPTLSKKLKKKAIL